MEFNHLSNRQLAASEVLGSAVRGIIAESVLDLLSIRPGRGNIRRTEKL